MAAPEPGAAARPPRARDDAGRTDPASYPLLFEVRAMYSDLDTNRHVNNVAYARWFEEGRSQLNLHAFGEASFLDPPPDVQLLLASTQIDYLAPVGYPATVTVASAVLRVGAASWGVVHALFHGGRCAALGEGVMVKASGGRPTRLDQQERAALAKFRLAGATADR